MADRLTRRALNRATLERQLLLRRMSMPALDAVHHLVGLQAQVPLNPYTALWSRLSAFDPDELAQEILERRAVRMVVMRGTIHLITKDDAVAMPRMFQPVLDQELRRHPEHGALLTSIDLAPILDYGRAVLAEPTSGPHLRTAMAERFPDLNPAALAFACRNHLALVQVPPRGVWGHRSVQPTLCTVEAWLGQPVDPNPSIEATVLRYLAAFGPATVADFRAWSRLTGLNEVFAQLRPRLRTFTDERARELFDLPDAPRPPADTPSPARFLPEYDNVLLSHADRTRFVPDELRGGLAGVELRAVRGAVLHDGMLVGLWLPDGPDGNGLLVRHGVPLSHEAKAEISAEGDAMLRFLSPAATPGDVRFATSG